MFPFDDHPFYASALAFILIFGALSFPLLFWVVAPYGRHERAGWGPTIKAKWGWLLMEAPSPITYVVVFFSAAEPATGPAYVMLGLWLLHYLYRAFIFPFRMRGGDKPKPVLTVALAVLFNLANGGINGYAVTRLAPHLTAEWLSDPRFIAGLTLFFFGWAMNHQSDSILRNLRAPGETGYKIPFGGAFRWVTSPNYLGEFIEWCGYALCSFTLAGAAFAFFTAANLLPRAVSHHRWYRERFPDYPKSRKAFFPFLL